MRLARTPTVLHMYSYKYADTKLLSQPWLSLLAARAL
jgi:hypothetical protein